MSINEKLHEYYGKISGDVPWRYRSWEHCFAYFCDVGRDNLLSNRDTAALNLAFYLASWGMYRGSSFLLRYDYTVHLPMVDRLSEQMWEPLWERDLGCTTGDIERLPLVIKLIHAVRETYKPWGNATDTLVTKIILGTLGSLPACDRFFINGFKSKGYAFSYLNMNFLKRLIAFCQSEERVLKAEQQRIAEQSGIQYPMMKLVDMYFWQIGFEMDAERQGRFI